MAQQFKEFGKLLKQFRDEKGWTQKKLSRETKISQATISECERGKTRSKRDKILLLADALELDEHQANQLLLAAGYSPCGEQLAEQGFASSEAMRILASINADRELSALLKHPGDKIPALFAQAWQVYGQAKSAQFRRDWSETIELCERAASMIDELSRQFKLYITDTKGTAQLHVDDLVEAEETFNGLETELTQSNDHFIRGQILTHQGELHRLHSQWDRTTEKFSRARSEFHRLGDERKVAWIDRKSSIVALLKSDWRAARHYLDPLVRTFTRLDEPYELAKVHMARGWAYSLEGNYEAALESRRKGLELAKEYRVLNRDPDLYLQLQGHLYYGYDCGMVNKVEEAESHLREAERLSEKLQEQKERGLIHMGLARLYLSRAREEPEYWQTAVDYFESAAEELRKRDDRLRYARTLSYWADAYLLRSHRDINRACELLDKAKITFRTLNHDYYLSEVAYHMALAHLISNEWSALELYVDEGLYHARLYPYPRQIARLNSIRGRALLKWGREKEAVQPLAEALAFATAFNRILCQRTSRELVEAMVKLRQRRPSSAVDDLCRQICNVYAGAINENGKHLSLQARHRELGADVGKWLNRLSSSSLTVFR